MITVQSIEQLHIVAGTVLRRHGGNVELALYDFMRTAADAGLTLNPNSVHPHYLPSIERTARQYLTAYAKDKLDDCED